MIRCALGVDPSTTAAAELVDTIATTLALATTFRPLDSNLGLGLGDGLGLESGLGLASVAMVGHLLVAQASIQNHKHGARQVRC